MITFKVRIRISSVGLKRYAFESGTQDNATMLVVFNFFTWVANPKSTLFCFQNHFATNDLKIIKTITFLFSKSLSFKSFNIHLFSPVFKFHILAMK